MNYKRDRLISRLAQAQRFVELGAAHIQAQLQMIADLDRSGYDSSLARVLLETYCETQTLHERDMQQLADELGVPPEARILE